MDIISDRKNEIEAVIIDRVDAMSSPTIGDNKILFHINEGAVVEVLEEKKSMEGNYFNRWKRGWVSSSALRKCNENEISNIFI